MKRGRKATLLDVDFPEKDTHIVVQAPLPGFLAVPPQIQAIPGRGSARQGASPPAPRGKPADD